MKKIIPIKLIMLSMIILGLNFVTFGQAAKISPSPTPTSTPLSVPTNLPNPHTKVRKGTEGNVTDQTFLPLLPTQRVQVLDKNLVAKITDFEGIKESIEIMSLEKRFNECDPCEKEIEKMVQKAKNITITTNDQTLNEEKFSVSVAYEFMKSKDGKLFAIPFPMIIDSNGEEKHSCKSCGGKSGTCYGTHCATIIYDEKLKISKTDATTKIIHSLKVDKETGIETVVYSYKTTIGKKNFQIDIETELPKPQEQQSGYKWCGCWLERRNRAVAFHVPNDWNCGALCKMVNAYIKHMDSK